MPAPVELVVPFSQRPDTLARAAAAKQVALTLVGMTVAAARAQDAQEAQLRGVDLRIEFLAAGGPMRGDRRYGRIRASVRSGVVILAG